MPHRKSPLRLRRDFLRTVGLAGVGLATTLWLPKSSRGAPPPGSVKRAIIVPCFGGVRWTACFDGQADLAFNPWGIASWGATGSVKPAPEWGFGRMLLQRPVNIDVPTSDWDSEVVPHLSSDQFLFTNRPELSLWQGATLPTFADVAHETAVVRCNNNPNGDVNLDHAQAGTCVVTGSIAGGSAGMATALYDGIKRQVGANLDTYYSLPPIAAGDSGFAIGVGDYAGSRPIILGSTSSLPERDPSQSVSAWGRKAEKRLDSAFGQSRPDWASGQVANLVNDKVGAELYGEPMMAPVLNILKNPSEALGETVATNLPVTNAMLLELFAVSSSTTPPGDLLFEAYAAEGRDSWERDSFGDGAAFALRMLQAGAPIAIVRDPFDNFDHHANEILGDPYGTHPFQVVRLARSLAALEFALKNIVDPKDPSASLWDSTVVVVCSEFGRTPGLDAVSEGGGSGHDPWNAWPIMGGPVVQAGAGGKLFTDQGGNGFYHQNRFFTTLMAAMGIDDAHATYLRYTDFAPISGLLGGV